MDFDPSSHPHRRYNPLTGEYVLVSPQRNKRPWQGQTEPPQVPNETQYDPNCYLCPGNTRSGGQKNEHYTSTMVFENDFPAILSQPASSAVPPPHPLLQTQTIHGASDVIVFHPRHDLTLARLDIAEIETVIKEWTKLYLTRGRQEGIKYVQIFENKGAMMGCSNPHPHCQAWSLSEIPTLAATELASLRRYSETSPSETLPTAPRGPNSNPCLLCEYVHYELSVRQDESRVVFSNEHWVALVPYWAVWPFEIMLLPYRRHIPSLYHLSAQEIASFAGAISRLTIKYDNLFSTSFAYSMGIHQRPTPSQEPFVIEEGDLAHLHLHFDPPLLRSATVRKFLVGFELMGEPQRDLTAEQAAMKLRGCSEVHYLDANI